MWDPPPADHINGQMEGYQIQYGVKDDEAVYAVSIEDVNRKVTTYIRKTCPYNVYPLEPRFYIAKLGYGGVYLFFSSPEPKAHR